MIEEVEKGLYNPAVEGHRWWFKYNSDIDSCEEIGKPECVKHFAGFTIG